MPTIYWILIIVYGAGFLFTAGIVSMARNATWYMLLFFALLSWLGAGLCVGLGIQMILDSIEDYCTDN